MRDLIVFGEDFGGLPSSTQHLVNQLGKQRKVLWINSIGLRKPKFTRHDLIRVFNKLIGKGKRGFSSSTSEPSPSTPFYVANLITLPAPSSWLARKVAQWLLTTQIKPLARKHQLTDPILWISLPTAADLCGKLGESAVVYYCGDDFSSLAGVDHTTVSLHEKKLIAKADLVLAASAALTRNLPQSKTHYLPHGVDYNLFNANVSRADDLPCGRPIAGFYGSLSNWIDYSLLETVCRNNPGWDFVFIGPIELEYNPLPRLNNVHYLGPKPHHELPKYSQHWNVGMLPFLANEQISACNPLKLMEYFCAGCHVITTPFPALAPYREQVYVVDSADEFQRALSEVSHLAIRPKHMVKQMKTNSWASKATQVQQWLEAL